MTPHSTAIAVTLGLLVATAGSGRATERATEEAPEPAAGGVTEIVVEAPPDETPSESESVADDSTHLEALAFPELRYRDGMRVNFQSRFMPDADLGPGHVSLYEPDLRARMNLPVSRRAIVRLSARAGLSSYQFRGGPIFERGGNDLVGESLDVYRTRIGLQGAIRLNEDGASWIAEDETWALLTSLVAQSRFESGAFGDAIQIGTGLALGYEIDDTLRLALGLTVGVAPDSGDVELGPLATFRWNVTDRVTLRDRGLGLQLEYRFSPQLELFVSGFRESDSYRLDDRAGLELSFRDRQILIGGGFEWKLNRYLRLNTELGAVTSRQVRVTDDDLGTLVSETGDPGLYIDVRVELRP